MTKKNVLSLSNYELDKVVKIQGTKFDRKRKLSDNTIAKIKWLHSCGKSYHKIANLLGVSYSAARYYTDPIYKYLVCHRGGSHAHGELTLNNRAEYKRGLVAANARVIYPMD